MENKKPRVLEVSLAPGETEAVHHNQWPSVLYIQEAGDFIDQFPMTMWKDAEAPHSVENLSKTITIRLIRVEMKK